jgi:hypothetical protein
VGAVLSISETRLAGYCSLALAATLVLVAIAYALLPGRPTDTDRILNVAGTSAGSFRFLYGIFALGGVFGLAVVGPITRLAGDAAPAWIEWAKRLAYVGFAVTTVQGLRLAVLIPQLGSLYHGCGHCPVNLADQQTLARWLYATLPVDPGYWVIFGAVSLWTLAVSAASLVSSALPRLLSYLGLALTAGYWVIILALATGSTGLFTFAALVTGIFLGPLWYIWLGALLISRR